MRFIREATYEQQEFLKNNDTDLLSSNSSIDITNINSTNESSLFSSIASPSSNKYGLTFDLSWNLIVLFLLALVFVVFLISIGLWYWCKRVNHLRRGHSLPYAENDFIATTKIQEKRLSPSPIKKSSMQVPPPVPPRPTAYTNILGKIEYRSNL